MTQETAESVIKELEHLKKAMCARELSQAGRTFVDKRIGHYKHIAKHGSFRFQNSP
jgi:hypothetical protein